MTDLIKKFIKTPDIVEAFEWNGKSETLRDPDISLFMANNPHFTGELGVIYIHTLEGEVREAYPGDYIVKGLRGEIFPVSKKVFHETYKEFTGEKKKEYTSPEVTIEDVKPSYTVVDMKTMDPIVIEEEKKDLEQPVEKPKKEPTKKKNTGEIPDKFKEDIKSLEERTGPLEELRGEVLELDLQELNKICPRVFVKAKSYMGLVGFLRKAYEIELKITSQRSK
jgi:hypothetical protein